MYIVYDTDNNLEQLRSKYLVLELDTMDISGEIVTAYSVIDNTGIPLNEISRINEISNLHASLMKNYYKQDWRFCNEAISHLRGTFKGELDSFYDVLAERIETLTTATIADDWTGYVQIVSE